VINNDDFSDNDNDKSKNAKNENNGKNIKGNKLISKFENSAGFVPGKNIQPSREVIYIYIYIYIFICV
jgi:hypothetical protein